MRKSLQVSTLPGYEKGNWSVALVFRGRSSEHLSMHYLEQMKMFLDAKIDDRQSIGSLLYHIALIEADWL